MGKKTEKAIGKLRADVQALSEAVWAMKEHVRVEAAAESAVDGSRKRRSRKLSELEARLGESGGQGQVSSYGTYRLAGPAGATRQVRWQLENASAESLVPDDFEATATVLAAIGHRQRLAIVVALMQQPMSVSDLVGSLDLGTSGAAYHHLNVLQNAGLAMQQERGTFELVPDQVGTLVGILAALSVTSIVEDQVPGESAATDDSDAEDAADD